MIDQHFTSDEAANQLVSELLYRYDPERQRCYIEPSCGSGAFVKALVANGIPRANIRSVELDENLEADCYGDFLTLGCRELQIEKWDQTTTVVIGNPPFGHAGRLARDFINHGIQFATLICMIVPRSMHKAFLCSSLNPRLELVFERDLPPGIFTTTKANCNWQEWFLLPAGQEGFRPAKESAPNTRDLYEIVGPKDDYDIVIQRCGGSMGRVTTCNGTGQGKYYIKSSYPEVIDAFRDVAGYLDIVPEARQTTHQGTLSFWTLNRLLEASLLDTLVANLKCGD
jgi:predicted RNA methylase